MSVDEKFICKIFILQWEGVVKHLIWYLHTTEILFIIKPKNHSILVISLITCNSGPVSLLSCVSKIMEPIVFKHVILYNYFHCNNLFYKYQAGFLPGHSTVYQLIDTYHSIVKNIDEGKSCCMVFWTCQRHLTESGMRAYFLNYKPMEWMGIFYNGLKVIYMIENKSRRTKICHQTV